MLTLYLTDTDVQKAGIINTDTYLRYNNLKSASHLWTADDYLDIIKAIDEIYEIVKARPCSDSLKDRFVRQFFTQFCINKYHFLLRKKYDRDVRQVINEIRSRHIKDLWNSGLEWKYKLALHVFSASNLIYRLWLLYIDPTMRIYEKTTK